MERKWRAIVAFEQKGEVFDVGMDERVEVTALLLFVPVIGKTLIEFALFAGDIEVLLTLFFSQLQPLLLDVNLVLTLRVRIISSSICIESVRTSLSLGN